jgi:hypothetical protein
MTPLLSGLDSDLNLNAFCPTVPGDISGSMGVSTPGPLLLSSSPNLSIGSSTSRPIVLPPTLPNNNPECLDTCATFSVPPVHLAPLGSDAVPYPVLSLSSTVSSGNAESATTSATLLAAPVCQIILVGDTVSSASTFSFSVSYSVSTAPSDGMASGIPNGLSESTFSGDLNATMLVTTASDTVCVVR